MTRDGDCRESMSREHVERDAGGGMTATLNGQPMAEQESPRRSNIEGMSNRRQPRDRAKPGELLKREWSGGYGYTPLVSLRDYARTTPEGRAWLERKKA